MSLGMASRGRTRTSHPSTVTTPTRESVIRRQRDGGSATRTSSSPDCVSAVASLLGSSAARSDQASRSIVAVIATAIAIRFGGGLVRLGDDAPP